MRDSLIAHAEIRYFAESRVNLRAESARRYREQVNRMRERLAEHIADNPGFALVKMLHAGSVAKGTALRTINDLDAARVHKEGSNSRRRKGIGALDGGSASGSVPQ